MAFKSSCEIGFPLSSFSSSLKVKTPFLFKASYRWSVKLLRVSSPLKLRKTSYFHLGVEEQYGDDVDNPWWLTEFVGIRWLRLHFLNPGTALDSFLHFLEFNSIKKLKIKNPIKWKLYLVNRRNMANYFPLIFFFPQKQTTS